MDFQIEHVAWQVPDPPAVVKWYVAQLGFRVIREVKDEAQTHFLADASGRAVIEIYNNRGSSILDYPSMHPLQLHIAFAVSDVEAARERLIRAGCTVAEDFKITPAGDEMVMLKDPWGFSVQLVKRAMPMR